MKRTCFFAAVFAVALAVAGPVFAQSDTLKITPSLLNVRLSVGFNYDLLRPLTDVSFQQPVGYFGLNVPINTGDFVSYLPYVDVDTIFSNDKIFISGGEGFSPSASTSQNANYTVRVDVPMLGGVGSFAYTQNYFLNFGMSLGGTDVINEFESIEVKPDDAASENGEAVFIGDGFLSMKGALRLPFSFSMNWETMSFGYVRKIDKVDNLMVALYLHRHLFSANVRLAADIDLLGHVNVKGNIIDEAQGISTPLLIDDELLNFSSEMCNGSASGKFRADVWTPSLGVKWGKFSLNSRFGLKTKAKGSAEGGFKVPQIVNLETGKIDVLDKFSMFADSIGKNPKFALDMLGDDGLIPKTIDTMSYEIGETFYWEMPQGHTLAYEIIPSRLSVSYTKLFGEVSMRIEEIHRKKSAMFDPEIYDSESWVEWLESDSVRTVEWGLTLDHILTVQLTYPSFFINVGICGMDIWSKVTGDDGVRRKKYAFKEMGWRLGNVSMIMPVLSSGVHLGTKLQLRIEGDLLPTPALRSGVNYYF